MNRCEPRRPFALTPRWRRLIHQASLAWCCFSVLCSAHAQTSIPARVIPEEALFAQLRVLQAPEVQLNGELARLSPGARIYSPQNLLVLSASLSQQTVPVRYQTDPLGLVHRVWLLTADEVPANAGNLQNWSAR